MNNTMSPDDLFKQIDEGRVFIRKHPWKHLWYRLKYYSFKYWAEAYHEGKSYFMKDEPFLKCLWKYIYLENSIYGFFYDRYSDIDTFLFRVKRIWQWMKVLWSSPDFDAYSIFPVLQYKLERIEKELRENTHYLNGDIDCAEIEYVLILLDKVQRHDGHPCPYLEEAKKKTDDYVEQLTLASKMHEEDAIKAFTFIARNYRKWWD